MISPLASVLETLRAGRDAAAERQLRALVRSQPDHAEAWYWLGIVLRRRGAGGAAVTAMQRALALRPDHAETHHALGATFVSLGQYDAAISAFSQAVALRPEWHEAHNDRGMAFHSLGRPEAAEACYRQALALIPDHAGSQNNLGAALQSLGRLEEAAACYRRALALTPDRVETWINLHSLLYRDACLEPAAQCLERALSLAPADRRARLFLAVIRDHQGQTAEAARHRGLLPQASDDDPFIAAALDSWDYLRSLPGPRPALFGATAQGLELGLAAAPADSGLVLEFGVRFGTSLRQIAARIAEPIHGFDTFQGLPESWLGRPDGLYSTGGVLPEVPSHVHLVVGRFEDTLPGFLAGHPGPIRFMNVDCDLYGSTRTVLDQVASRIVPGTVIVFDEYLVHRTWREDEFKAFQEAVCRYGWRYRYLGVSLFSKQAVVRIEPGS